MEVSMATTNTAGEPGTDSFAWSEISFCFLIINKKCLLYLIITEAFKYLKTSDSDERMEGSKKVYEDEEQALKVRFQEWMNKFNRNYKDEAEKAYRFEVFKSTVQYVEKFNAEQVKKYGCCKCTLGTNKFADLTVEEVSNKFCGKRSRQC